VLRRSLVQALSGGIFGLFILPASAQQKMSQTDAEYQDRPEKRADLRRLHSIP